jgi:hypothetical protein
MKREYERDEIGRWTGRYGTQEELNALAYERWVEDRNTEENDDDGK